MKLKRKIFFLGSHKGKFGTASSQVSGGVLTGKDLKEYAKLAGQFNHPKTVLGAYGPKVKFDNAIGGYRFGFLNKNDVNKNLIPTVDKLKTVIKKQKFNKSTLGKIINKIIK